MLNTQQDFEDELNKLKNLSFRYGQWNRSEVINFYDEEIARLFSAARLKGIILPEDGEMQDDYRTIIIKKANAQAAKARKKEL
jgi:hypothetical protein